MNHRIRVPEVRVIGSEGQQLGVMKTFDARLLAEESGLDLVEVASTSKPPVCKIMDYGKFKYEEEKKKREAKKKQTVVLLKEVKLRPTTDEHDLQTKLKHMRRFLEEGNKVKVTVAFRGREMAHREFGFKMLTRVTEAVADLAKVELSPKQEGRFLSMVLAPLPKSAVKKQEVKKTEGVSSAKIENKQGGA